ncbi:PAS domain [Trinorchestia longiramus]|nr:PAS domain [Trinorchestia longiramus]
MLTKELTTSSSEQHPPRNNILLGTTSSSEQHPPRNNILLGTTSSSEQHPPRNDILLGTTSSPEQHPPRNNILLAAPSSRKPKRRCPREEKESFSARHMRNLAEKMRRDKLNTYVSELANIIPLVSSASKKVDKTSVLRIAANYIRLHNVLGGEATHKPLLPSQFGSEAAAGIIEALGNRFLLVATNTGKIVYVSEAVEEFFGHSQLELLGSSLFPIIHPDDQDLLRSQLSPKEITRRSFFCRMAERVLTRNESRRYEIVHIQGRLRPIPPPPPPTPSVKIKVEEEGAATPMSLEETSSPVRHRRSTRHYGSLNLQQSEDDSSESEELRDRKPWPRSVDTHLLVALVQLIKERPITELSRLEAMKDEYITRHDVYGNILYTDHRISVVTGHMPDSVRGTPALMYMHSNDMLWSLLAQKHMLGTDQGQGRVTYRLRCSDNRYITLRSRGFLEFCKQTGKFESFVCINSVISDREAEEEIRSQRRKLLPVYSGCEANKLLATITSELPLEILQMIQNALGNDRILQILKTITSSAPAADVSDSSACIRDSEIGELEESPPPSLFVDKSKKLALTAGEKRNSSTRGKCEKNPENISVSNTSRKRSIEINENFDNSWSLAGASSHTSSSNSFKAVKHCKIVDITDSPEVEELMTPINEACGSYEMTSDVSQIPSLTSPMVMSPKLDFGECPSSSAVDSMQPKSSYPSTISYEEEEKSCTQSNSGATMTHCHIGYIPSQAAERSDNLSVIRGSGETLHHKSLNNYSSCQLNTDSVRYKTSLCALKKCLTSMNEVSLPEKLSLNSTISNSYNESLLGTVHGSKNAAVETTRDKQMQHFVVPNFENGSSTQRSVHSKSSSKLGGDFSLAADNVLRVRSFDNRLPKSQTPTSSSHLPMQSDWTVNSGVECSLAQFPSRDSHEDLTQAITQATSTLLNNCDLWHEQKQSYVTATQPWGVSFTPESPTDSYSSKTLRDHSSRGPRIREDNVSSMTGHSSVSEQVEEQKTLSEQTGSGQSHSPPPL